MDKTNILYPFGEGYDSYLEYQMNCPNCGKVIHLFLPAELTHTGYSFGGNNCHNFWYTLNRGTKALFPNKVVKLRSEVFGGSDYLLFDNYHLYPIIPSESKDQRKARLTGIMLEELDALLISNPEKKKWIIEELINRNDTILNSLEEILKTYENTEQDSWDKLDNYILETTLKDDATSLLGNFNVKYKQVIKHTQPEPVNPFFINSPSNQFQNPFFMDEKTEEQPKPAVQTPIVEWTCTCGTKTNKKFCPNCGYLCPELNK